MPRHWHSALVTASGSVCCDVIPRVWCISGWHVAYNGGTRYKRHFCFTLARPVTPMCQPGPFDGHKNYLSAMLDHEGVKPPDFLRFCLSYQEEKKTVLLCFAFLRESLSQRYRLCKVVVFSHCKAKNEQAFWKNKLHIGFVHWQKVFTADQFPIPDS